MSEYYISYGDLERVIDKSIEETSENNRLTEHKAEIMAALTSNFKQSSPENINENISLWENQIKSPSQLLMGTRYVRISQILLEFLKVSFTSGIMDALIKFFAEGDVSGFSTPLSISSSIAFGIWDLFNSVKKLDDWDFCVYMQAVTHFREYKEFTYEELVSWFPDDDHKKCNMHTTTWECDFLDNDDMCSILQKDKVESSLNSLYDKGLLAFNKSNNKFIYKFKK